MAYHPDNISVYNEIRQSLSKLIPFVGAGLTQFAYYSWDKALKELSNKLTNVKNKREVNKLIKAGHYMDAAQMLEDLRTPSNLARDIADLFSADKLEEKREQLHKEPISLLPYLFPELVLTTNFDKTLETVYEESGYPFQQSFLPGHLELLSQFLRQGGTSGLLKLHGTITGGLIEYDKIVFTQAQYDKHYGKDSLLTHELKTCFETRLMFFLGCSLENDRTMELLQKVIKPGYTYYTIISCRKSKRDEKIGQLGEKHIRAILYEDGRHEAVRVILEHLLEETKPDIYHALPVHVGALKSINLSERFSYKAGIIPFIGRERELLELQGFLGDPGIAFRWWAVTGPGGAGKSRLAYEFQRQLPPDWVTRYLGPENYEDLSRLTEKLTQKTLLIADYVQENAKAIGKWMEQLNERERSLPIRVLLVERNASDTVDGFGWMKQLYEEVHHEQKLRQACYQKTFLILQPLRDGDLVDIMESYVLAVKSGSGQVGKSLPASQKHMLLQKLKSIDSELCRPLYALFLTDAYVNGQNPERWDRDDVLNYITGREQKRLKFNIKQLLREDDKKLWATCLRLQCTATILQNVSIQELEQICPEAWKIIERKEEDVSSSTSPSDMLEQIGLAVDGQVPALKPDLIGEYVVYTWLRDHPVESWDFLCTVWKKPSTAFAFFNRLFHDYDYLLNESQRHWEMVLPKDIPTVENMTLPYALLLLNATHFCDIVEECERQVGLLEEIAMKYSGNLAIVSTFAEGLANLSSNQDEQGAVDSIQRLERFTEKHPEIPGIAVAFARSLANLSIIQDEQGALDTTQRLELLMEKHPSVQDIVFEFARGLASLSKKQDEQGILDTAQRLERLMEKYPDEPDIATAFAQCLSNLSIKLDVQEVLDTIERLEYLAKKYPDMPDIASAFASGLVTLSNQQDEQGALDTIQRLEFLAQKHPHVPIIVTEFAKGLVNLSIKQNEQDTIDTVGRLERLTEEHPDVPNIAISFAEGLFVLSSKQDEQGALDTIGCLERLAKKHSNVPDIAIAFASGLVNLINKQDEQGALDTIGRLKFLTGKYPDVPDIAVAFSIGLTNLIRKQDEQGALNAIRQLERLTKNYPGVPAILIRFASGLVSLSNKQDKQGALDTIRRLESLTAEYPSVQDIAILFAMGLSNLTCKQDEQGALDTIRRLENLTAKYQNVLDIASWFAIGLANLISKQDEREALDTIRRLEDLVTKYPDYDGITYYLSYAQDFFSAKYRKNKT